MNKQLLLFFFLFSILPGSAQNPLVKQWDARFGGNWRDELYAFTQTNDGGYILGGWSYSGVGGDRTQPNWDTANTNADYWVVKIDSLGNKQWDRRFGGVLGDYLSAVHQLPDGNYILGGMSISAIGGDKTETCRGGQDFWLVKTDSLGNKIWDRRFGGSNNDYFFDLKPTKDGGFIAGGWSTSNAGGDKSEPGRGNEDYWIVKVNAQGIKEWDKRFGGTDIDELHSLQQTADGGYILGGFSGSGSNGDKTQSNWDTVGGSLGFSKDYWIVKTDSLGIKQWDKRYGGTSNDYLYSLQQTTDGGYILGGYSFSDSTGNRTQATQGSADYWMVKTDALGNQLWDKRFGGNVAEDLFGTISQTTDHGYLLAGTSYSGMSGDKTEANISAEQIWLVKTDSLGHKQWDKTIFTAEHDEVGFAMQTKDGCYAAANFTLGGIGGYKTQSSQGDYDYWIVKFCDTSQHCNLSSPTVTANQTVFCSGDSTLVCATASSVSYLWNTGQTSSCIYANHAGNYYVTVADANNCSAVSNHLAIHIYPLPPVSVSVYGDTLTAFNAVSYQWYHNGSIINGAIDSIYIAKAEGFYTVEVTDTNGCRVVSNPVSVVVSGIALSGNLPSSIRIYPNPATNQLFIQTNNTPIEHILLYNIQGQLMLDVNHPSTPAIDISAFSTGVYVADIRAKGFSIKQRWIKL